MTPRRLVTIGAAVVVAVFVVAAGLNLLGVGGGGGYKATFVFPHATNLFGGSRAQIDGFNVGLVDSLEVRDGKALVKVTVDDKHAPLREGTTARIDWQSLPGERIVQITPGPKTNAALPDGAMITATTPRIELDQVLSALDPETRAELRRIIPGLDAALAGHEEDLGQTLEAAGPALHAATDVLDAIGGDGPALQTLLTSVRDLAERLVARRESVRGIIDGFDRNLARTADHAEELAAGLDELPATLRAADSVLGQGAAGRGGLAAPAARSPPGRRGPAGGGSRPPAVHGGASARPGRAASRRSCRWPPCSTRPRACSTRRTPSCRP